MRKFVAIVISIIIGFSLGMIIINQYRDKKELVPVFNNNMTDIYFIELGKYNSLEEMQNKMLDIPYYIYNDDNDIYTSYIGISTNEKNALKIKGYFDNLGYVTNIEVIGVSNTIFIDVLKEYDKLLETSNDKTISSICSQILSEYEELVNNESKN